MRLVRTFVGVGVGLSLALAASQVVGMPMFARKYELNCNACHTVIPKLNETGMMFRASGWRPQADIGSEDKGMNDLSNSTSARLQGRYDLSSKEDKNKVKTNVNQLSFFEATLYPLTGAFNKNFASMSELTIAPEELTEIENAYVRGDWKAGAEGVFSARAGIFHPWEGYGASDRPLSISRPILQTQFAKDKNGQTFVYTPWNLDQMGLEVGYDVKRTLVRATLFNGISYAQDDAGKPTGEPAQGGGLAKDPTRPSYGNKDYQVSATQILTPDGGGVTAIYYNGAVDLPVTPPADVAPFTQDKFWRFTGYASYPVIQKLMLLGGYMTGEDKYSIASVENKSTTQGAFGEADFSMPRDYWLAARYDWFDPSTDADEDLVTAFTAAINRPFNNGLQFIAEYQYKETEQGFQSPGVAFPKQKESKFQIRGIWIW